MHALIEAPACVLLFYGVRNVPATIMSLLARPRVRFDQTRANAE